MTDLATLSADIHNNTLGAHLSSLWDAARAAGQVHGIWRPALGRFVTMEELMTEKESQRQLRLQRANAIIVTISNCGRHFFRQSIDGRVSKFEIAENGRLYFRDKYSDHRLPCSHTKGRAWQQHFTEGGTLKSLIEAIANYIKTGETISLFFFGPWAATTCNGDLWGYGDDMELVREHAKRLGIVAVEPTP